MRLFVALDLPYEVRQRLAGLAVGLQGARWVPPENYHVTLRFIGETPGHRAEEIDLALAALRGRAFSLVMSGVGTFVRSKPPCSAPAFPPSAGDLRRTSRLHVSTTRRLTS
jgi:2'-5' RNA ligase